MKGPFRHHKRAVVTSAKPHAIESASHAPRGSLATLAIGALGIVYGDIGTSPLYAMDQLFLGHAGGAPTPAEVLGGVSLVIWTITVIVAIKYAMLVLRAQNDGEGGVFALYGLLHEHNKRSTRPLLWSLMLGAGLLFGDGIITPAISVLSAVEGLEVATPAFASMVVPITVGLLTALFAIQFKGTSGIGIVFGPILLVWFVVISGLGSSQIFQHAEILWAFNPVYGLEFLAHTNLFEALVILGALMLGAGLLFGDGMITPAISVLSAVEGLEVAAPALTSMVVPITIGLLTALFAIQFKGTSGIGIVFGPILLLWFVVIAGLGGLQTFQHSEILWAFNPVYGLEFLAHTNLFEAFIILGALMLVVTGGEAMYADVGHFGTQPIRASWFAVVYPALLLNYLGQGAYLLTGASVAGGKLFYSLVPSSLLYPMVLLATVATIIASQALISGAFSLVSQAIRLGLFPRLALLHTHRAHAGQI